MNEIKEFIRNLLVTESHDWFYHLIPTEQTPEADLGKPITKNKQYISIDLKSMRIVNVRTVFSKFYGVVNSFVTVSHASGKDVEFKVVTTPSKLEALDKKNLDRVITNNIPLLGEVPYLGDRIKLEVGLCSVKSDDIARNMIDFLSDMTETAGVSFINQALPYTKYLGKGLEALSGDVGDVTLEIGISTTYAEEQLKTGYYVVMRAPKDKIDINKLKISPDDFRLVYKNGESVSEYPYLVFKISATDNRSDYFKIPEIADATNKIFELLRLRKSKDANAALGDLYLLLLSSQDILQDDAMKIYQTVSDKTKPILELLGGTSSRNSVKKSDNSTTEIRASNFDIPSLKDLNLAVRNE